MKFSPSTLSHTKKLLQLAADKTPVRLLLCLSGGADSVFLFHLLLQLREQGLCELVCAHFNHGWREASDLDEQFCRRLAARHNVPLETSHPEKLGAELKFNGSLEELGRRMRRTFFEQVKKQHQADFITTAHHADDQLETFFIRLSRGSSLDGLCGIRPLSGGYLRPLLQAKKSEILSFLNNNQLTWRHDESNELDKFLRNRIRRQLLPQLEQIDPRMPQKILESMQHLHQDNQFVHQQAREAFYQIFEQQNGRWVGEKKKLLQLHKALLQRVIILWLIKEQADFAPSQALISELLRFIRSDRGGKHQVATGWAMQKKSGNIWIEKI